MQELFIEGTDSLPTISFKPNGELKITGRALPEDAAKFFSPLFEWISGYTSETIDVEINLDYFNTSVSKQLLDFFRLINNNSDIREIRVRWLYEDGDEEMLESGEIYQELLPRFTFVFQKYEEVTR
jgi:hypothetical protein